MAPTPASVVTFLKSIGPSIMQSCRMYTPTERRITAIYILGIMLYKLGYESFQGSITSLATNRYDFESQGRITFQRTGLLQGMNLLAQCLGSIIAAPLIKRFSTRLVLLFAVVAFALISTVLLIVDVRTGGKLKPKEWETTHAADDFSYYGTYATDLVFPVYCSAGVVYGMVELIRRVIPRDIVGTKVQKLKRMDAIVHVFYEAAGTAGAILTAEIFIPQYGNNMAFIITPIAFTLAGICWFFIANSAAKEANTAEENISDVLPEAKHKTRLLNTLLSPFKAYITGGKICTTSRLFIWLIPGFSFSLFAHKFLENTVTPMVAKRYLGNAAWSQIMVGGSNLGELLGALCVLLFTDGIPTPMPWLRFDAAALLLVWFLRTWSKSLRNMSSRHVCMLTTHRRP